MKINWLFDKELDKGNYIEYVDGALSKIFRTILTIIIAITFPISLPILRRIMQGKIKNKVLVVLSLSGGKG